MTTTITLTAASHDLFIEFAKDAGNWSGAPLVNGNVEVDKQQRGNLSDLVQKGLVIVDETDDIVNGRRQIDTWVFFTAAGVEYAAAHGVDLAWIEEHYDL